MFIGTLIYIFLEKNAGCLPFSVKPMSLFVTDELTQSIFDQMWTVTDNFYKSDDKSDLV